MKLLLLWPVLLAGLFRTCHQASHTNLSSVFGQTATTQPITLSDTTPGVTYTIRTLRTDTTLFEKVRQANKLTDETLTETSGLTASYTNPGCLWTEEDSGNDNEIQLLNKTGTVLARYVLDGIVNRDWEDIATGPGPVPGKSYIYLAEIGDNNRNDSEKIIYRFPEPLLQKQKQPYTEHIRAVDAIRLQLSDGPHNAEAILLDPIRKDLLLLTKGITSTVYQAHFPQSTKQPERVNPVLILPFEQVTAASVSSTGQEILIRTYNWLFYYRRRANESILEALKRPPLLIPLQLEPQGEAVSWSADASGFYTSSEKTLFTTPQLFFYPRKKLN